MRVDGLLALLCKCGVIAGALRARLRAGQRQRALQVVEQAVEVDREDGSGTDGAQVLAVGQPAAGVVPATFGAGTQVAVDLGGRAVGHFCGGAGVVQPGFRARGVALVPIAVEHAAIGQTHHVARGLAGLQVIAALHPVGIFLCSCGR